MADMVQFLDAVASHWFLLSMAVMAFSLCQFVDLGDNRKVVPVVIMIGIGCIMLAFYLAVNEQLTALNQSLHGT
jgi:hypothetical protein